MGIREAARFYLARLRERLWLKPLMSCILSLAVAFIAGLADHFGADQSFPQISSESIETLLTIISASMLVIAVFTVGSMLSAYASASDTATPRSFPLVIGDDVSQNALSTFIGAFIFSVVAQIALLNEFYENPGRFFLFLVTIFVFGLVILSFVRWVDRIARLGRLGNTIYKVEAATDSALKLRASLPTLGAAKTTSAGGQGVAIYPKVVGYVQNIEIAKLQSLAEQIDAEICICAPPGTFATPGQPLGYISKRVDSEEKCILENAVDAFVIGRERTFESDPRFGLIVLSEIASRALSPAVNDTGTAIEIIGSMVRLFVRWVQARDSSDNPKILFARVSIPVISLDDMFDDAFNAIARDGASSVEVAIRLQKAFYSLSLLGHSEMRQAAIDHADFAFSYAEEALELSEEIEAVRSVIGKIKTGDRGVEI